MMSQRQRPQPQPQRLYKMMTSNLKQRDRNGGQAYQYEHQIYKALSYMKLGPKPSPYSGKKRVTKWNLCHVAMNTNGKICNNALRVMRDCGLVTSHFERSKQPKRVFEIFEMTPKAYELLRVMEQCDSVISYDALCFRYKYPKYTHTSTTARLTLR